MHSNTVSSVFLLNIHFFSILISWNILYKRLRNSIIKCVKQSHILTSLCWKAAPNIPIGVGDHQGQWWPLWPVLMLHPLSARLSCQSYSFDLSFERYLTMDLKSIACMIHLSQVLWLYWKPFISRVSFKKWVMFSVMIIYQKSFNNLQIYFRKLHRKGLTKI